jgi:catechol 2,3-dioxygenase-like lactoylglutathione lyase family enzyme
MLKRRSLVGSASAFNFVDMVVASPWLSGSQQSGSQHVSILTVYIDTCRYVVVCYIDKYRYEEDTMSNDAATIPATPSPGRLQLALNVEDLEASERFYTNLFGVGPVKKKPGYVNFAIAEPPLKLILFEGDTGGTINHLGVEVATSERVSDAIGRLEEAEMEIEIEEQVTCCYASQDKVWTTGPDGEKWEYYTVLADVDENTPENAAGCCTAVA